MFSVSLLFELVGCESVSFWSQCVVSWWSQSPLTRITFYLVWANFSTADELGFHVSREFCHYQRYIPLPQLC